MTKDIMISRFRPTSLNDVLGQSSIVTRLKRYAKAMNMPHCMFTGDPGIGKTSSAVAFFNELYGETWQENVLEMNASDERGIDKIRGKVQDFTKVMSMNEVPFKIVFLDEGDHLTTAAQATLRRVMEDYSLHNRFILSCNYAYKVIPAIQDRCAMFRFSKLKPGDIFLGISKTCKLSNIKISDDAIHAIAKGAHGSMRKALNILEDVSIGMTDEISLSNITDITGSYSRKKIGLLIHACKEQNLHEVNNLFYSLKLIDKLSVTELVHEMVQYIDETNIPLKIKERMYYLLAEVEWRCAMGSDDWIQFRWFLSQIKDLKKVDLNDKDSDGS